MTDPIQPPREQPEGEARLLNGSTPPSKIYFYAEDLQEFEERCDLGDFRNVQGCLYPHKDHIGRCIVYVPEALAKSRVRLANTVTEQVQRANSAALQFAVAEARADGYLFGLREAKRCPQIIDAMIEGAKQDLYSRAKQPRPSQEPEVKGGA